MTARNENENDVMSGRLSPIISRDRLFGFGDNKKSEEALSNCLTCKYFFSHKNDGRSKETNVSFLNKKCIDLVFFVWSKSSGFSHHLNDIK